MKDTYFLICDDNFKLIKLTLKNKQKIKDKTVIIDYIGLNKKNNEEFEFNMAYSFSKDTNKEFKNFMLYAIKKYLKASNVNHKLERKNITSIKNTVSNTLQLYSFTIKVVDKPKSKNKLNHN